MLAASIPAHHSRFSDLWSHQPLHAIGENAYFRFWNIVALIDFVKFDHAGGASAVAGIALTAAIAVTVMPGSTRTGGAYSRIKAGSYSPAL